GEGLQHADGHSLLLASTNPAAVAYDPAFSYEIAHIVKDGLRRMYGGTDGVDGFGGEDIFYYITLYNEPYSQPAEPADLNVEGLLKGMYLFKKSQASGPKAQILVSGVTMPEGLRAQQLLADEWGVAADVWSVTSWGELRRDGIESERQALRDPGTDAPLPYVTQALSDAAGPFVAASDWMRAVADQIRQWVPGSYTTLG
ncbi:pyruvate dehydrogenase (acetyl-transferring), homodimeric type, partial [Rhodococcus sp. A14]|nr:pyruvate dehydrogenase (acetyl-transferring), homodimeric type [Rhodococcus sp. A14]